MKGFQGTTLDAKNVFEIIDVNNDGSLTFAELAWTMSGLVHGKLLGLENLKESAGGDEVKE